jgi:hypothetical protein
VLLDRSPLTLAGPFDLHTLGAPLAFVLSQDQTLHEKSQERGSEEPLSLIRVRSHRGAVLE